MVDICLDLLSLLSFENKAKYSFDSDCIAKTISYLNYMRQSFLVGARFKEKLYYSHNSATGLISSISCVIAGLNEILIFR